MNKVKIVAISDTHNKHFKMKLPLPQGDILVHAGDSTNTGQITEIKKFNHFLQQECKHFKHIVCIAGNHDWGFQREASLAKKVITEGLDNVHYLRDESVTLEGIKFYGSPWQPEFCNWAFNLPRGKVLADVWDLIPNDTDVLITHGPPYGYLDDVAFRGDRVGCVDLAKRVDQLKPKLHIFGHIHRDRVNPDQIIDTGSTKYVNASVCTESNSPTNPPVVLEVEVN